MIEACQFCFSLLCLKMPYSETSLCLKGENDTGNNALSSVVGWIIVSVPKNK